MDVTTPEPARRIIGEVIADGERIILYTQGRKCGLVALPEKEAEAGQVSLQLLSAWPKGEGEEWRAAGRALHEDVGVRLG